MPPPWSVRFSRRVGVGAALDFFRLLTIIVISGTSTVGSTLFRG